MGNLLEKQQEAIAEHKRPRCNHGQLANEYCDLCFAALPDEVEYGSRYISKSTLLRWAKMCMIGKQQEVSFEIRELLGVNHET